MEKRLYFDAVAELYESSRPGYPSLLIEDLLWLSRISPGAHILDVGCGTGKSTEPFARRGFQVCALDPGANMLALCKKKLQNHPNVTFENAAFETWPNGSDKFDLVISGTAFHWVTDAGYRQLLRVLRPQGAVGVFWHTFLRGHDPIHEKLDLVYRNQVPHLRVEGLDAAQEMKDRRREEQMLSWAGFAEWRVIRYYSSIGYSAKGYSDLVKTWPDHGGLSDAFFRSAGSLIEEAGGEIVMPVRTTLCFGRRSNL
ncbi:MAG: class I SAM-dependent methyltransferase [Firmicutes bacterium]|nr:class I SAM-dependent methyltransferase [Bacillota bacterium]